jgi:hypothetical protein
LLKLYDMKSSSRDSSVDNLLRLDGQVLALDPKGEYWARFAFRKVEPTTDRPHGLDYVLTLHGPGEQRIFSIDNGHAIRQSDGPASRKAKPADHEHVMEKALAYRFSDGVRLLQDFWAEADSILKEKGVRRV